MIGHLGTRTSALLDGQLPAAEAERLWAHVHGCHLCRDLVEREGWVKTRLSGLGAPDRTQAPAHLKGALLGAQAVACEPTYPSTVPTPGFGTTSRPRRVGAVAAGVWEGHGCPRPGCRAGRRTHRGPARTGRQPHPAQHRRWPAAGRAPDPSLTPSDRATGRRG